MNGHVHRNMYVPFSHATYIAYMCVPPHHHSWDLITAHPTEFGTEGLVLHLICRQCSVSATCKDSHETTEGMKEKRKRLRSTERLGRGSAARQEENKRHKAPRLFDVLSSLTKTGRSKMSKLKSKQKRSELFCCSWNRAIPVTHSHQRFLNSNALLS